MARRVSMPAIVEETPEKDGSLTSYDRKASLFLHHLEKSKKEGQLKNRRYSAEWFANRSGMNWNLKIFILWGQKEGMKDLNPKNHQWKLIHFQRWKPENALLIQVDRNCWLPSGNTFSYFEKIRENTTRRFRLRGSHWICVSVCTKKNALEISAKFDLGSSRIFSVFFLWKRYRS